MSRLEAAGMLNTNMKQILQKRVDVYRELQTERRGTLGNRND